MNPTRNAAYTRPRDPTDPGTSASVRPATTNNTPTVGERRTDALRYIERYAQRHNRTANELAQILAMLGLCDPPNAKTPPPPPAEPVWQCGTIPGWLTHLDLNETPCEPCTAARSRYMDVRNVQCRVDRARGRGVDMTMVRRAIDDRDRCAAISLTADERLAAAVHVVMAGGRPATVSRRLNIGWPDANRLVDLVTSPPVDVEEAA